MADYDQDQFDRDDYGDEDNDSQFNSLDDSVTLNQLNNEPKNQEQSQSLSQDNQSIQSSSISISHQNYIELLQDEQPFGQANKIRITNPYMSRYQKAIIIGRRATQISNGSAIYTNVDRESKKEKQKQKQKDGVVRESGERRNKVMSPLDIAEKEFKEGRIPFIVRRYLPNREFEDWKIQELLH